MFTKKNLVWTIPLSMVISCLVAGVALSTITGDSVWGDVTSSLAGTLLIPVVFISWIIGKVLSKDDSTNKNIVPPGTWIKRNVTLVVLLSVLAVSIGLSMWVVR